MTHKIYWMLLTLTLASCTKVLPPAADTARLPYPTADSAHDVKTLLDSSQFTLFRQAAARVRLDTLLPAGNYFTILAPVDSAMQSAGLTASVIAGLPTDSLQKIVLYHVTRGLYSAASLTAAVCSIQAGTLRQDISFNNQQANVYVYQQTLYLKMTGSLLYANGEPVDLPADTPLSASNGYIFPIRTVLQAPELDLWQVFEARPELSMYLAALRMEDSIYYANGLLTFNPNNYTSVFGDSLFFNMVHYTNQTYGSPVGTTVLAPTNAAFAAAGFNSVDDLRAFETSLPLYGSVNYGPYNYTPMDSVLKQHLVGNYNYSFTDLSLYNDLLFNPDINNGSFNVFNPADANTYVYGASIYTSPVLLQFSNSGGMVSVRWSANPAIPPAILPSAPGGHFMAQNGVVYEINQLFYPHN